jgi:type VI secretion system protein ImpF
MSSRSVDPDLPLLPSILDRLLDDDPSVRQDSRQSRRFNLAAARDAVRRDLENLLNARQRCRGWPKGWVDLDSSIINYGLPDFATIAVATEGDRDQFREAIERTIRTFEPRFKHVSVHLLDNAESLDRTLRFRVDALMYADPAPEPIVLDSVLDPATRSFAVVAGRHG